MTTPYWTPHNGWLTFVMGGECATGDKGLPPPESGAKSPQYVDMVTSRLGRIRITYEAQEYKVHRGRYWRWAAKWADKIDADGNVIAPK